MDLYKLDQENKIIIATCCSNNLLLLYSLLRKVHFAKILLDKIIYDR